MQSPRYTYNDSIISPIYSSPFSINIFSFFYFKFSVDSHMPDSPNDSMHTSPFVIHCNIAAASLVNDRRNTNERVFFGTGHFFNSQQ